MRKILPLFLLLFFIQNSFGQTTSRNTTLQKPQSISQPAKSQLVVADTMKGETIEHCDATIRAIDIKFNHVNSDQAQKDIANANGWFDQMAKNRAAYVARRAFLLNQTTNK